ncbi:MAG: SpoVG family protein [Lachnospiraceae bacterium]|nr:SpoVG family protein [Lachnospiraceae bacterium]
MTEKAKSNGKQKTQGETQSQQAKQTQPLDLEVRIQSIKPNESIKGTVSVNINGAFAIRGIKIIEGSNGLFVSMPSYKVGNDYKDICFPITPECRQQLNDAVIGAYEQALMQSQNSMAKHHEMRQAPEGQAMDTTGM